MNGPDSESSPLLTGAVEDVDKSFLTALDHELEKICSFYQIKELEIYGELESTLQDEESFEADQHDLEESVGEPNIARPPTTRRPTSARQGSQFKGTGNGKFSAPRRRASTMSMEQEEEDSDEDEERAPLTKSKTTGDADDNRSAMKRQRTNSIFDDYNDMSFSALYDTGLTLKKRIISIYVQLCELRSFIQLNQTGFRKVLKKYDKILDRKLKDSYMSEHVEAGYPFQQSTMERLKGNIEQMESTYATLVTHNNLDEAKRELRLHLREHVVWERNTVWREMIGIERKAQAANMGLRQTMLGRDTDPKNARMQGDDEEVLMRRVKTPFGTITCPTILTSSAFWTLLFITAIFMVLLFVPLMDQPEQQNCLALVVFVSLLWATEVSPVVCMTYMLQILTKM